MTLLIRAAAYTATRLTNFAALELAVYSFRIPYHFRCATQFASLSGVPESQHRDAADTNGQGSREYFQWRERRQGQPDPITQQLQSCTSFAQLNQIIEQYNCQLSSWHVGLAFNTLRLQLMQNKHDPEGHTVLSQLEELLAHHILQISPKRLDACLWCYSRVDRAIPEDLLRTIMERIQPSQTTVLADLGHHRLSILCWTLSRQYELLQYKRKAARATASTSPMLPTTTSPVQSSNGDDTSSLVHATPSPIFLQATGHAHASSLPPDDDPERQVSTTPLRLGDLLVTCCRYLVKQVPSMTPWNISLVLRATAGVRRYSYPLLTSCCQHLLHLLPTCNEQDIGVILKSLASHRFYHRELLDAMLGRLAQMKVLHPIAISQAMTAAAVFDYVHMDFLKRVRSCVMQDVRLSSWHWGVLLWALCTLRVIDAELLDSGLKTIAAVGMTNLQSDMMAMSQLCRVYQVVGCSAPELLPVWRKHLPADMLPVWRECSKGFQHSVSQLHKDVALALQGMGAVVELEHEVPQLLMHIDIKATWQGRDIAVEVDGPTHFMANDKLMENGETACRRVCLQALGWPLVQVRKDVWDELRTISRRRRYLQSRLDEALSVQVPTNPRIINLTTEHE